MRHADVVVGSSYEKMRTERAAERLAEWVGCSWWAAEAALIAARTIRIDRLRRGDAAARRQVVRLSGYVATLRRLRASYDAAGWSRVVREGRA